MSSSKKHEGTVNSNDRGNSGYKGKQQPGNGRNKHSNESAPTKRSNQPNIRGSDNPKAISTPNSRPIKVSQAPPAENVTQITQNRIVPSTNPTQEPSIPRTAPIVQPQVQPQTQSQPHFQYPKTFSSPSFGQIPPRTHSAPPNLQEQEKQSALYYPEKSHNSQNFKQGFPYTYYGFQPTEYAIPPNIPYMPPTKSVTAPPIRKPAPVKSIIAIIDPDSNEEVVINDSPPKTRNNTTQNTKLNSGSMPGGILPEFSAMIEPVISKPIIITDPEETPKTQPTSSDTKTTEPTNQEIDAKSKKIESSPLIPGKKSVSGKQRQEFRVKSPGPKSDDKSGDGQENLTLESTTPVLTTQSIESDLVSNGGDSSSQEESNELNFENQDTSLDSHQVAPPKKKNLKEVLKKADGGNFKAYTFDAYSESQAQFEADQESAQGSINSQIRSPIIPQQPLESEEEDDWENKDESELMNLRRASPFLTGEGTTSEAKAPINISTSLSYSVGIWRPDNQDGKKLYDRSFLLQFQPLCTDRPPTLPDMSEVFGFEDKGESKDSKPTLWRTNSGSQTNNAQARFRDSRSRSSTDVPRGNGPPGFSPINSRNATRGGPQTTPNMGNRGNKMKKGQRVVAVPEVTLVATPGRWEPSVRQKNTSTEHKAILKNVKGVLNKLTEEKFDLLSDEIINVGVVNDEILKDIIKLVFDKALSEPRFGKMYAELCRKLSASPNFSLDDKAQTFKRILLNRCQEEFESSFKGSRTELNTLPENTTAEEKLLHEEQLMLQKKKMLGNITFIGELYKIRMLTEPIMHECITKLLGDIKNPSHSDIEALCVLMTSIGAFIDHQKAKNYIDQYFTRMKELSRNNALPSRIRFMLQDVIELRNCKWVIQRESNALNVVKSSDTKPASSATRPKAPMGQRINSPAPVRSPQPGEWEQVPTKSKQQHRPQKLPQEEPKLPSFFGPAANSLSQGARGWKSDQPGPEKELQTSKSNRGVDSKSSELSSEELEAKSEALLKDYLSSVDLIEAITCVKELDSPSYIPEFVKYAISVSLEKKSEDRENVSKLFSSLREEGLLLTEAFQEGIQMVLEIMEDLVIDIPNCPTFVGVFIANAVVDDYFSFSLLESLLKPFVSGDGSITASALVAEIISSVAEQTSWGRVRGLYRKSKMDLMKFLPSDQRNTKDLTAFLEQNELTDLLPQMTYGSHLEKMLKERSNPQTILKWIQESVPLDVHEDVPFGRHFFKCVLQQVFVKGVEKETPSFKDFAPALKIVLSSNFNSQLNSLFEAQLFCYNEHFPKGLMENVFEYLYSFEIVTADVFIVWTEDEGVPEGKKEALAQTNQWVNKLKQQIEDEDRD